MKISENRNQTYGILRETSKKFVRTAFYLPKGMFWEKKIWEKNYLHKVLRIWTINFSTFNFERIVKTEFHVSTKMFRRIFLRKNLILQFFL